MAISERIKELRKHLNLTQTEFGDKIGLKQNTVGQMESGSRSVTERTIILICEKFNVNKVWLSKVGAKCLRVPTWNLNER